MENTSDYNDYLDLKYSEVDCKRQEKKTETAGDCRENWGLKTQ